MTRPARQYPALSVETRPLDDVGPLIALLNARHPLLWMRRGFGLVGLGCALRMEFSGPSRLTAAAAAWREVAGSARVVDPLADPGTGLVALGSFAFSDHSGATSVLIVPSVVIGRRAGRSWVTRIGVGDLPAVPDLNSLRAPSEPVTPATEFQPGELSPSGYTAAVTAAVGRIRRRELSKAVLARDLIGHLPPGSDLRGAIAVLGSGYPDCWTYAVDGLIGSSPETLISVDHGTATARVLAGSAARGADADSDQDAAVALATSAKDQDEHEYAVQNVLGSLRRHSADVTASEVPFTLKLPNLWHLASDVEGTLVDGSTSLDLLAAVHPTAAVAGTPTATALGLIEELEPFDRGRYAGPVGWVGADGDGEWAIALRCAQVTDDGTVTAHAGAGIVAESIAEHELVETRMKFRPIIEAFS
ncbi:chorismate-binding protein [Parafrigoribacterium mesophilum]|uniref:isochorismate synthase n=1 Tax=Parafrigoribacterium mesophilum TaxID=433646 RepID=UPI0031FD5416